MQSPLVLDNVPAHPLNIEGDILEEFTFIKVLYQPNTPPAYAYGSAGYS